MPDLDTRRLQTSRYRAWKYEDAAAALKSLLPKNYEQLRKYVVDHDHFQGGTEWVGPGDPTTNTKIEKQFVSDDAVGEAVENVANAFGEAFLSFVPLETVEDGQEVPPEVQRKISEARSWFSDWWDKRLLQEHVGSRLRTSAWAGFSGMGPWVPARFKTVTGSEVSFKDTTDMRKAMSYVYIRAPLPSNGGIYVDPDTQDKCSIFLDEQIEFRDGQEIKTKRAEITFLDPDRDDDEDCDTMVRVLYETGGPQGYEVRIPLGGSILFSQMNVRALLTDPVIRSQRQLNLLCSLITRLGETAAFRGRYLGNVKPEGNRTLIRDEIEVPEVLPIGAFLERDDEQRLWLVTPEDRTMGAATTQELVGLEETTGIEGKRFAPPFVFIEDPVDPTPYINAAEAVRRRVLRQCSQGHLATTATAESSGLAYEQSRAAFAKDLNKRRVPEEGMLRETVMDVFALAEYISGQDGYFTQFVRPEVNQYVDPGPRSPEAAQIDLAAFTAGVYSKETTQAKLEIEDIEGENIRLRKNETFILNTIAKAIEMVDAFGPESALEVLKELGLPANVLDKITIPEPEPVPVPGVPANAPTA